MDIKSVPEEGTTLKFSLTELKIINPGSEVCSVFQDSEINDVR